MAAITAELVKNLRESTGAGMMDCKKALNETNGDLEAAIDWLRKKGLAAAAKKAGRVAAEGLVGVQAKDTQGVVVEVNAETDFVARNEKFQDFVKNILPLAVKAQGDVSVLAEQSYGATGQSVSEEIKNLIATIGENMNLRRCATLTVSQGVVSSYMHSAIAPGLGRIGVLVALESAANPAQLEELGKQLAMHIAAAFPLFLNIEEVDPQLVEREKSIFSEQAKASGRPADIIEKMIEGRVRKYYEEVVLLEQAFVMDGKTKISDVVMAKSKELGHPIVLKGFVRYMLGDGIEKQTGDFAAEVAAQLGN